MVHEIMKGVWAMVADGFGRVQGPFLTNHCKSGQPISVYTDNREDLLNMFYMEGWTEETEAVTLPNGDTSTISRGVVGEFQTTLWATDFTEAEANSVASTVASASPNVHIEAVKHPDRDEWALPVHQGVLDSMPDSPYKTQLNLLVSQKHADGKILTKQVMIDAGWKEA